MFVPTAICFKILITIFDQLLMYTNIQMHSSPRRWVIEKTWSSDITPAKFEL